VKRGKRKEALELRSRKKFKGQKKPSTVWGGTFVFCPGLRKVKCKSLKGNSRGRVQPILTKNDGKQEKGKASTTPFVKKRM